MSILTISKSIGAQISIIVLISVSVLTYLKDDLINAYKEVQSIKTKELDLSKKELEFKDNTQKIKFFKLKLSEYLNNHSHMDLSTRYTCDSEYMKEFRKAKATLKALEGAAIAANLKEQYSSFFESQNSISGTMVMQCRESKT